MSKPQVPLIGEDGNVFNLMAIAGRYISKDEKSEMLERVTNANSYEEALNIIQDYVEII